jgi:hypothetical protein
LVNWVNGNWDDKEILINNAILIVVMNAFLSPTLKVFDFFYYFKLWQRKNIEKELKDLPKDKINISQREVNEIYEGPKFELDNAFADLGKTGLCTFFFIPIFPCAVIISIVGLIYTYWVDKVTDILTPSISSSIGIKNLNSWVPLSRLTISTFLALTYLS